MAEFVQDVLDTEPSDVVSKFPWPKTVPQGKTAQVIASLACRMPPYHGRCRTTVVVGREERVINRRGETLSRPEYPQAKRFDADRANELRLEAHMRWQEYDDLTPSEFASKMNALKGSQWIDAETQSDHFSRHADDFKKFAGKIDGKNVAIKTAEDYVELSRKVLTDYDRLFVYYDRGLPRTMFYRKDVNVATIVDDTSGSIVSSYPLRPKTLQGYENKYVEVKP